MKEQILQNKKKDRKFLLLYELVFDFKNKDEINKKYEEILESIKIGALRKQLSNIVLQILK